ncbi:hypothetical protein ACFQL4_04490 [Halosimplex aquaticum]
MERARVAVRGDDGRYLRPSGRVRAAVALAEHLDGEDRAGNEQRNGETQRGDGRVQDRHAVQSDEQGSVIAICPWTNPTVTTATVARAKQALAAQRRSVREDMRSGIVGGTGW